VLPSGHVVAVDDGGRETTLLVVGGLVVIGDVVVVAVVVVALVVAVVLVVGVVSAPQATVTPAHSTMTNTKENIARRPKSGGHGRCWAPRSREPRVICACGISHPRRIVTRAGALNGQIANAIWHVGAKKWNAPWPALISGFLTCGGPLFAGIVANSLSTLSFPSAIALVLWFGGVKRVWIIRQSLHRDHRYRRL
jgi:uncharacterized membrane protein HdeD (DUF308 family)